MKVVRDSKFRHVNGEAWKEKYEDLRLANKISESNGVRGNAKFVAIPWESGGGGTMAVIPSEKTGRIARDLPLITGHTAPILDFEFNPFNDNMLATASEDQKILLWDIPDGGYKVHQKEPLIALNGHAKKITFCHFNPSANGILASTGFDCTIKTWSLYDQEEVFNIDLPEGGAVNHLKWNYTGSLLAATCKDKKLRIVDPRTKKFVLTAWTHEGSKPSKVEWLGGSASSTDENYKIVTTGFTAQAGREISVWDIRKIDQQNAQSEVQEPMNLLSVDPGTGALFPFFDPGTQMLYVGGRGDGSMRYFEAVPDDPFLHFLSVYSATTPQKGMDFLPKRCMDVTKHEVARCLKMESSFVGYISFRVPRKSKEFQEDIFPDCPAGRPSMTAEEWTDGVETRPPLTRPMKPSRAAADAEAAAAAGPAVGIVSVKDLKKQLAEAEAKIKALETENEALKKELAELKGA